MQTYFINPSEDGWVLVEQGSDNVLKNRLLGAPRPIGLETRPLH